MQTPSWKDVVSHHEDDVNSNSGRTDDSLLSSRTSQETVNSMKNRKRNIAKYCQHKVRRQYYQYKLLIFSILLSIFGVLQIIFPPYDLLLNLRIRMTPGLPPFDWWLNPPDEVVAKIYIFNVTNPENFLNGSDTKIKLQEIGPIIYRENLRHTNPIFNNNSTLTYTAHRSLIYLPDRNPVYLLNQTITMPNIAVLFVPSYFYDAPFFVRFGVNLMIRRCNSELFKTGTIEDFLWNMTDPILDVAKKIAPSLVPSKNVGILAQVYSNFEDNVTVLIGPKFDQRDFFRIDNVDGSERIPSIIGNCENSIKGSSEGTSYFQQISKNDTLKYLRKTICKIAELKYKREVKKYGMKGYRFELDPQFYNRLVTPEDDCYKGMPVLPNGLNDISHCYYGMSVANSNPHFLNGDIKSFSYLEGINPDPKLHTSFVDIEPVTGTPLQGEAKSQINLAIKDMKGFNEKLHKFSNLNIPLVWIEYNQEGLPPKIQWMMYLLIVVLPVCQIVSLVLTFVGALILLILFVKKRIFGTNLERNSTFVFESEKFLKK